MSSAPPQAARPAAPAADRSGFWILFATILASSMAFIDGSALNVALPALQTDLNASGTDLLWILNGYLLMLASLILVGGSLGDHYGRKRVFQIGIILFAAASFACGLAPTTVILIAARIVQGIGGALMVPGSLSLISVTFDESSRGKAIGTWAAFSTLTPILGPVLGGFLAGAGLWRGVFFINLPLAILASWALFFKVKEPQVAADHSPLDFLGATLATLGLAGLTYGFIEVPSQGLGDPLVLLGLVGGVIALAAFVVVEARSAHPMMPLSLFSSRTFTGTNLATLFLYGALSALFFLIPLNLIQVQGYPPAIAGLTTLPFALLLTVMSRFTGAWADRVGPRPALTIGPAITGLGFFAYAIPSLTRGPIDFWTTYFPPIILVGIGMGITVAPLTTAVMTAVSSDRSGIASGINNAVSRIAGVLAIAILGALVLLIFHNGLVIRTDNMSFDAASRSVLLAQADRLGDAQAPASLPPDVRTAVTQQIKLAFVDAFRADAYICAALAILAAVLAFFTVPGAFRLRG